VQLPLGPVMFDPAQAIPVPMGPPGANDPMLAYPRGKPFEVNITPAQDAFPCLRATIDAHGWRGIKMYLWAKRVDDEWLQVHLGDFPDQNQNW
jgi:hypothetical protein